MFFLTGNVHKLLWNGVQVDVYFPTTNISNLVKMSFLYKKVILM